MDEAVRICADCKRPVPTSGFYSKGKRLDSRCKKCVLKTKAKCYKVARLAERERLREINEFTVTESPFEGDCFQSDVGILLREFISEAILDYSAKGRQAP